MKRFKKILCALQSEKSCQAVLERAVTLAENYQAELTVVDVAPPIMASMVMPENVPVSADLQGEIVSGQIQKLKAIVEPYCKRVKIETKILVGTPFLEIIREVLREGHDLVIKMPEDKHWAHRFFGSDDMHLLRKCPHPVLLIKPQAPKSYRRILAAVDVNDGYAPQEMVARQSLNREVLSMACTIALAEFAELHIVYAWQSAIESAMRRGAFKVMAESEIDAYVEKLRRHESANLDTLLQEVASSQGRASLDYLKPGIHLVKGWPREEIPALAKDVEADLVVMGTVARTGVPGLIMGNTAETILNHLDCSVLAIKPPDFVTPVQLGC